MDLTLDLIASAGLQPPGGQVAAAGGPAVGGARGGAKVGLGETCQPQTLERLKA